MMKVAVVTPIPTPYRDPLWCEVARQPGVDLRVMYCSGGKPDRAWSVNWVLPPNSEILPAQNLSAGARHGESCFWNPAIRDRMQQGDFDRLIVGGYNHPTMLWAIEFARRRSIPFWLMCESHLRKRRGVLRRFAKEFLVRRIARHAAGGMPTGRLASDYLEHYGIPVSRQCLVPNVPDVNAIWDRVRQLRSDRTSLRNQLKLHDAPTFLYVGRLVPVKGVDVLIRSFAAMSDASRRQLVIVGDGPERMKLEDLAEELGVKPRVQFAGFQQPDMLPMWYAAADVFVLPSSETWGVVVLEALAAGLSVVVTDEVGCYPDAINSTRVGSVVPVDNIPALTAALQDRMGAVADVSQVERAWRPVREAFGYRSIADRIVASLNCVA